MEGLKSNLSINHCWNTIHVGLDEFIDDLFVDFKEGPGASLSIIKDSKVLFSKSYGMMEIGSNMKCNPKTNFRLASLTKQFTAISILILMERGKLGLEEKLSKFFVEEDLPFYAKQITIHHLLSHTSGIIDYEDLIDDNELKLKNQQLKDEDVFEIMKKVDDTYFPIGSQFRYSNTAYAFLALIVGKVSGISFAQFLKENVFDPLGKKKIQAFFFSHCFEIVIVETRNV